MMISSSNESNIRMSSSQSNASNIKTSWSNESNIMVSSTMISPMRNENRSVRFRRSVRLANRHAGVLHRLEVIKKCNAFRLGRSSLEWVLDCGESWLGPGPRWLGPGPRWLHLKRRISYLTTRHIRDVAEDPNLGTYSDRGHQGFLLSINIMILRVI